MIAASVVIVLCQLVKNGYFMRRKAQDVNESSPGGVSGPEPALSPEQRRSLIIQAVLLAVVFSVILAVTTFYWAPLSVFRNRVVAAVWGLFFGIPAAAAFVVRMSSTDN